MKTITEIANKNDSYFRSMALHICKDKSDADDLVQDMYLKLYRYDKVKLDDMHKNGVSKFLCVRIINQLFLDSKRKNKKEFFYHFLEDFGEDVDALDRQEKADHIRYFMEKLYWFDSRLFDEYVSSEMTMRGLSKATGINLRSIFNAITRAKTELQKLKKHKALE